MKNFDRFRFSLLTLLIAFSFTSLRGQCTVPEQPITVAFAGLILDPILEVGETRTFCVRAILPPSFNLDGTVELSTNVDPYPYSVKVIDAVNTQELTDFGDAATIVGGELYQIEITGESPGIAAIDLIQTGEPDPTLQVNLTVEANMPVTWSRPLAARPTGKLVELNLSVQDQVDVAGYALERSLGTAWEAVNEIPVIDNDFEIEYHTSDILQAETTYYRIRQWDFDGTESFSNIVQVAGGTAVEALSVFPNPANHELRYTAKEEIKSLRIYNRWGQMMREVLTNGTSGSLMINDLAPGVYIMVTDKGVTRQFLVF
ncbi:MAG: T9SS type A sorting domain-containing protein [Bacteroidota bacterium]